MRRSDGENGKKFIEDGWWKDGGSSFRGCYWINMIWWKIRIYREKG